jgi:hypothetical protein
LIRSRLPSIADQAPASPVVSAPAPRRWIATRQPVAGRLPPLAIAGAVVAAAAAGILSSLWPTAAVLAGAVVLILTACIVAPTYAFLASLALYSFEGSIKMRLSVEGAPSPLGVGAALLDLGFLASLVSLLVQDRGRSLTRLWASATRLERGAMLLLAAWLGLSVLQIPVGGSVADGLAGFRLTQLYVPAVLGGVLLAARIGEGRLAALLFGVAVLATAYAALRGIIGPSYHEQAFAAMRGYHTEFDGVGRDIGSFTSPFALVSFLVPMAILFLVLGVLLRAYRAIALVLFALAMTGIIASYVRTALIAVVVGAILLAALLLYAGDIGRRRKGLAVGLVVLVLGGGYAATLLAGNVAPMARDRAQSLANPFTDQSTKDRLKTWQKSLERVGHKPLGTGVGTVGRATLKGRRAATTDNSYLKVLQEQGVPGGLLFTVGLVGLVVALVVRLARAGPARRPLGIAALTGFVGFLVLMLSGEYIEQPGKLLAWTLLGVATWEAIGPAPAATDRATLAPLAVKRVPRPVLLLVGPCVLGALLVSVGLTASRQHEYTSTTNLTLPQAGIPDPKRSGQVATSLIQARLNNSDFQKQTAKGDDFMEPSTVPQHMKLSVASSRGRWTFSMVGSGPTPEMAEKLGRVSRSLLGGLGSLHAFVLSKVKQADVEAQLKRHGLSKAKRKALERKLFIIAGTPIKPTARPTQPTLPRPSHRLVDRLANAATSEGSPSPNVAWAALAALLFTVAVGGSLVLLTGSAPRSRPRPGCTGSRIGIGLASNGSNVRWRACSAKPPRADLRRPAGASARSDAASTGTGRHARVPTHGGRGRALGAQGRDEPPRLRGPRRHAGP